MGAAAGQRSPAAASRSAAAVGAATVRTAVGAAAVGAAAVVVQLAEAVFESYAHCGLLCASFGRAFTHKDARASPLTQKSSARFQIRKQSAQIHIAATENDTDTLLCEALGPGKDRGQYRGG